jgi:hypothetical protein
MSQEAPNIIGPVLAAAITVVGNMAIAIIQNRRRIPRRAIGQVLLVTTAIGAAAMVLIFFGLVVWVGILLLGAATVEVWRRWLSHGEVDDSVILTTTKLLILICIFAAAYETKHVGTTPPLLPKPAPARSSKESVWDKLRKHLCEGNRNDGYVARVWPYPEWVKGKPGLYREVVIYSVDSQPLLFDATKYKIPPEQRSKFGPSVDHFVSEVIGPMDQLRFPHRVYVRGSADKPGFLPKAVDPGYRGTISLVRALSEDQYSYENDVVPKVIGETYENSDLPALRARHLQRILGGPNYRIESVMVDGGVYPEEDKNLRNAVLVVYVELPAWVLERSGQAPCMSVE